MFRVCSTFLWLIVLLLTAALFRGFLPITENLGSYAVVVLTSVFIQEVVRYGVWRLHKESMVLLEAMAVGSDSRFALVDKLYMALAWGYGHGACHMLFFYLSLLPLSAGGGTLYTEACPHMSFFLAGALSALAFGMILPSVMLVSLDGYSSGNRLHVAFAPAMHVTAAVLSLGNLRHGGCLYITPMLLVMGVGSVIMAAALCWQKGSPSSSNRARLVVDAGA
ncbi:MAG: hypothetical protein WDW38_005216 [Sanguina aurantia]